MFNKVKSSVKNKVANHVPSADIAVRKTVNTLKKLYGDRPNEMINVIMQSVDKNKSDNNKKFLPLSALLYYAIDLNKDYDNNKNYLDRIVNIIIEHDADDAKFSTGYIFLVRHDNRLGDKINDYYNSQMNAGTELCIPFMVECVYGNFDYLCKNNEQFIAWKKIIVENKDSFNFFTHIMDTLLLPKNIVSWEQFYEDMPVDYQLGVLL